MLLHLLLFVLPFDWGYSAAARTKSTRTQTFGAEKRGEEKSQKKIYTDWGF
jgi:hypothetical protein